MTAAEQIICAVKIRYSTEANQDNVPYLNDENQNTPNATPKEGLYPQRITHLSGKQAAPGDDGLRPFTPHPGLNRDKASK
jgi:hypothetical protein